MASNTAYACGVCGEEYDEEARCPRLLPCFHSLCTHCIDELIVRNRQKCPFCRQYFREQSAKDFRINSDFIELLKLVREMEIYSKQADTDRDRTKSQKQGDLKKETGKLYRQNIISCQEAQQQIRAAIESNDVMFSVIQKATERIQRNIVDKVNGMVSDNKKNMDSLRRQNKMLAKQLMVMQEKHKELEAIQREVETDEQSNNSTPTFGEVEAINVDFQEKIEGLHGIIHKDGTIRLSIGESLTEKENIMAIITDVLQNLKAKTSDEELNRPREKDCIDMTPETTVQVNLEITTESLRQMNATVRNLIQEGQVYAVKGKNLYAQISIINNKYVGLQHLHEQAVPLNVHLIQFEEVMKLANPTDRLTYLTLQSFPTDEYFGSMIIHLTPESKRSRNFAYLCSGEMGPSYAKTMIIETCNKATVEEWIRFGDYELKSGKGGKSVVKGAANEWGGVLRKPWLAGTVTGRWVAFTGDSVGGQFDIFTKDIPGKVHPLAFGIVVDGLHVLTDAVSCHRTKETGIGISDCGTVLLTL